MIWKSEYKKTCDNISNEGFSTSVADCRAYFSQRISAKVAESDGSEQLKEHLKEMATTGFDSSDLLSQLTATPMPKDWEVGEAFAESVLEDKHEAMFPWNTGWDKRTARASLPGPDLTGFQNKKKPRFLFGEIKSSSEQRTPPQVVHSSKPDCLREQIKRLRHQPAARQQLVQWLLLRVKGTDWEPAFNDALKRYSENQYWLAGILVRGACSVDENDLSGICEDIGHTCNEGEVTLLAYYLPFPKEEWPSLLAKEGVAS
jgi:hypothetical protein